MEILKNQLISGGLFLGAATILLYGLKGLGEKVVQKLKDRLIFRTIIYDYDELFYVLENWISKNYPRKCNNVEASYEQTRKWVNGIDKDILLETANRKLHYKQEPNLFTINIKGKQFIFSKDKKELEHANNLRDMLNFHYSISAWNGKKAIQNFLEEITEEYNKSLTNGKISIYSSNSGGAWSMVGRKKVKTIDKVVLPKDLKEFLVKDLDTFRNAKNWYENINVTYKRSFLLYGVPGTGKTTTAQAIAAYMKKDICSLNLSSIGSDTMMIDLFTNLPSNSLLLIEDIDCVFEQRKPVNKDIKITFSCLLNCLDGIISKEDTLTIVTTNHLEKLDPALIRAGRMDVKVEIPLAGNEEIQEYLTLFYGRDYYLGEDQIKINMSAVQEACLQNRDYPELAIKKILNLNINISLPNI